MQWIIWHNPRCRKSRETLSLLHENGITPDVRLYLKDTPSRAEIISALESLGKPARDLVRVKEPLARELGLNQPGVDNERYVDAMSKNPSLIERPVVFNGDRAILGRPPEATLSLL